MSDISNDVSISPKTIAAIGAPKSAAKGGVSALAGLASSFQSLLQGVGFNMEKEYEALADPDFTGNTERDDAPRADGEYALRPDDGDNQRSAPSSRSDYGDNDRSQVEPAERRDDYRPNDGDGQREERAANGGGQENGDDNAGDQGDDTVSRNDGPQGSEDTAPNENNDAESAKAGGETADSESGSQAAENGETADGANAAVANSGVTAQALTPNLVALAGGAAHTADGQASDQGKASAASGLAAATQNIQKASAYGKGNNGAAGNGAQNQISLPQTNADGKAAANANTHSALKGENQAQSGATGVQNQASGLARAMGDGVRTQVNVSVTNEAQTLTSRPGQTLITGAAVSAEDGETGTGSGQTGTGTRSAGNSPASAQGQQAGRAQNTSQPQAQGQQAQSGLIQAQAQAQGQGQQGQVLEQVASGAKGGIGSTTAAGASGGTSQAGGGEGTANTGAGPANASEQAQQTQKAADAKTANRPANANRPVAEQISVRITKAVQAGKDRINIQLRPANMGRVEVKMEISQDGRLTAIVTADRPETLEQLKNDSRDLQSALKDAGLQTQSGDLTFNLRGEQGQENEANASSQDSSPGDEDVAGPEDTINEQPVIASDSSVITKGRIDVRA